MSAKRPSNKTIAVFVEAGSKRAFAGALDWPGWCRGGRDATAALDALLVYGPRYARAIHSLGADFVAPAETGQFRVLETVRGNATTDFGAPGSPLSRDSRPMGPSVLRRSALILTDCFEAFVQAAQIAEGKRLRTGPRGGGRELDSIVEHVLDANRGYLRRLAWAPALDSGTAPLQTLRLQGVDVRNALTAAVTGGLPSAGPRGGKIWTPSFFVRRIAWHMLDHAWEIEDRIL